MVAIYLVLALAALFFFGYGLTRFAGRGYSMMPVVGYALSQLLFFLFYFIFSSAGKAIVATFAVAALINVASLRMKFVAEPMSRMRREIGWLAGAGILLVLIAAWPYFMAGWGSYWHSGNEDAFDAINGRDAYLHQEVAIREFYESMQQRKWLSAVNGDEAAVASDSAKALVSVYAEDLGRLQYSSTAFWSLLLDAKQGMDAWLIQALLNLLLMGYGLVLLFERTLPLSRAQSIGLALVAVVNNFYLTTYFNGHQGSLMFMAIMPFGLYLLWDMSKQGKVLRDDMGGGVLLTMLLLFVMGAYPYPLPFFVLAIVIYWLLQRISPEFLKRRYPVIAGLLLLLASYVGTWFLFEPVRDNSAMQFRSWGTVFNAVGFFQFWGIWPSMLASSSSEFMNWLVNSQVIMLVSYAIGGGLVGLAAYGLYRAAKLRRFLFLAFAIMWLTLFPFMRFIVADSYYFYKFLYINNFFVVALVLFGYIQLRSCGSSRALKVAASLLVGLWIILNLTGNLWATWAIGQKPYNVQAAEFVDLIPRLRDYAKDTYIDFPKRGKNGAHPTDYESVARSHLWDAGLQYERDPAKAKYFLRMNGLDDIAEEPPEHVLWQSALFRLVEAPTSNLLTVKSYWAPEYDRHTAVAGRDGRFRWVSDGESKWLSVDIARPSEAARFLHFCAAVGPSVDYHALVLHVGDAKGNLIDEYKVDIYGCHWVDLAGRQGPFRLSSDAVGHEFSLIDTRHLNFRIFNIGVSSNKYDLSTLRYLNEVDDIIVQPSPAAGYSRADGVYLVNGWHGLERQAGEKFRWARSGANLFIGECAGELAIDIEPGPSLGRQAMKLTVRTPSGHILANATMIGRSTLRFQPDAKMKERVIEFTADSAGLAVPGDPRRLDFRVFGIAQPKGGHCIDGRGKGENAGQ